MKGTVTAGARGQLREPIAPAVMTPYSESEGHRLEHDDVRYACSSFANTVAVEPQGRNIVDPPHTGRGCPPLDRYP